MGLPAGTSGLPLPSSHPPPRSPEAVGLGSLAGPGLQICALPRDGARGRSAPGSARRGVPRNVRPGPGGGRGGGQDIGTQSFWGAWLPGLASPLYPPSGVNCPFFFGLQDCLGLEGSGRALLAGQASRDEGFWIILGQFLQQAGIILRSTIYLEKAMPAA